MRLLTILPDPPIFVRVIDISMDFLFKWTGNNIPLNQKLAAYSHLYSYTSVKSTSSGPSHKCKSSFCRLGVAHWFQIIRNKCFHMYDDDIHAGIIASIANRSFYKVAKFPTRNITAPVVLVYGGCDSLVDIRIMLKELPSHTIATEIHHFEHLDFLWGQDVEKLVFPHVIKALETYSNGPESMGAATTISTESKAIDILTEERGPTPEPRQSTVESLPTYSEDEAAVESHAQPVVHEELEAEPEVEAEAEAEAQPEVQVVPEVDEGVDIDSDADAAENVGPADEAEVEAEVEAAIETDTAAAEAELAAPAKPEAEVAAEIEEADVEKAKVEKAKVGKAGAEEAETEETPIEEPAHEAATPEPTLESPYEPDALSLGRLPTQPLPSPPIVTTKEEAPVGVTITPPKSSPSEYPLTPPTRPGSISPPRQPRDISSPSFFNSAMRAGSPLARSTTSSHLARLSTPSALTGLAYPPPTGPAAQTGVALTYGDRPITPMTQKVTRSGSMGSTQSFGSSNSINGGGLLGASNMSVGSGRPAAPLNEEGIPTGPRGYVAPKRALFPSTPPPAGLSSSFSPPTGPSCFSPPTGPRADRSPPTGPRNPTINQRRYTNSPSGSPRSSPQQNYSPGSPRGATKSRRRGRGRGRSSSDLGPTTIGTGHSATPAVYRGHGEMRMYQGEGSLYSDKLAPPAGW